eukprot:CAMPEP_0113701536 /NCGR_PEP_ID=MMETSP0038_2-20120614/24636_1 /TAXON_ID=2898 /ORGANISM="Cryptomonas paramecium" /LENGTH=204 /DNA_ID=CAMNT_0000625453 /DNA_START=6 /DNA_END=617 /DNA_ORIENTATION=- /assembly_acc=CAM_ASM_000170
MFSNVNTAILCLAAVCLLDVTLAQKGFSNLKEGDTLNTNQEGALPDIADPTMMKAMKCTACQASVLEMSYGILRKENDEQRKLKEFEVVEILEKVCSSKMDEYGLALDPQTGNPTMRWTSHENTPRAKGGWVTRLALGTCADVYNEYEEYLTEEAPKSCQINTEGTHKNCDTRALINHICVNGFKWCKDGDLAAPPAAAAAAAA